jgi:predicted permease
MSAIRGIAHRLRVLVDPEGYAREVEREIRFHLDREAMHKRALGLDDLDAEWAARRQFGNVTYVREEVRRMTGMDWIDRIRQNVAYALRGLRRSPGFTAAVVLTLGLGLGVNAAMFTFLDRVFVKPPAGVENPEEVRRLYASLDRPKEPGGRTVIPALWFAQAREIRRLDSTLVFGLFRNQNDSVVVKVGQSTFNVRQGSADARYFKVLGVRPQLGRLFDPTEDDISNPASVAVISDAMWQRVFGGNPQVIGEKFFIKYRPMVVIGVAPKGFSGIDLDKTDYWVPLGSFRSGLIQGRPWYESYRGQFTAVARFDGAHTEQRLLRLGSRVAASVRPVMSADSVVELLAGPLQASLGPAKAGKEVAISLRLGGVGLIILIITLANVSNLLLLRATRREREIAVRRALGVSRARLFEQLVTESLLLSVIGGAVALLLAVWVGVALRGLLLPDVHWPTGVLDTRVAAFAFAAAVLTGLTVGIVPAIGAWKPDLLASLRAGAKNGTYRSSGLRTGLLVAQAALSVVLLVGSGLFVRSLQNVRRIDVGFDFDRVHYLRAIADTGSVYQDMWNAREVLAGRLASLPGVEGVTMASDVPMRAERFMDLTLPGLDSAPPVFGNRWAAIRDVAPGYFGVVGQRIVAGREFIEGDPPSAIVTREMANVYWPGQSALGKCIIVGGKDQACRTVVGVTVTTHRFRIVDEELMGQLYLNRDSLPALVLRVTPERREAVAALVSAEVKRLIPRATIAQMLSLEEAYEYQFRPWRLGAALFTAMGVLALIVSAVGVYSVIAYATSQRTNEMGIRIALGAKVGDIARLVVGDGLRTVAVGIVVGVVMAFAAGKLVASLLYGISPRDPVVMASAAMMLGLIGIIACMIPAWRAARVDPVTALRAE